MNPKIQEEKPVTVYEIKTHLGRIKRRDEEMGLMAGKTEEYVNKLAVLSQSDAKNLQDELEKLEIPRFKDHHLKKVVDILPRTVKELEIILQGYTLTVSKDNMKKVMTVIKKYLPKEK